ncbi:MAG: EAL domain-containing protein [Candidatus Solibacter usitatus]|nr:EAL domain-containing protein [Candidatus Solibacter usitatus]
MKVFVARQAIVDPKLRLHGYELLFRSALDVAFDGLDGEAATSQVIRNSLISIGLDRIVAGRPAFVNFTKESLLRGYAALLTPGSVVIEILESVDPDPEVIAACRKLKQQGYTLALDDFSGHGNQEPLIEYIDILKVDFRATTEAEQATLLRRFRKGKLKFLAEKVETNEEFRHALELGYDYFQGYFIGRPATLTGREIPGYKLHYLRILREAHRLEMDLDAIEKLIRQEASLTYQLLRYINSALFGWSRELRSIGQAVVMLGEIELRRWVCVATLPTLVRDKPLELAIQAAVRARFCELIGEQEGQRARDLDLFLIGMFSLLDAMLDRPMADLLDELGVAAAVRDVLLGSAPAGDRAAMILGLARAYENAQWASVASTAAALGLPQEILPSLYAQSTHWAAQIF